MLQIKISNGNSKIGLIPNVNLPAGLTCRKDAPCQKGCYAKKGNYLYSPIKKAYENNLQSYKEDNESFFNQIIEHLNGEDIIYKYFRWHSSGDIVDYKYLLGMVKVANACPQTKFLCYTKKHLLINSYLALGHNFPSNLTIVLSGWDKDFEIVNPYNLPTTLVKFNNEAKNAEIKQDAFECPGLCKGCRKCWELKSGEQVYFHKH